MNGAEVIQAAIPPSSFSLPENQDRAEVRKTSEVEGPELKKQNQLIETARKPHDPTQAAEDSELKRQKIEFQIHEAIRLRAISGVTVYFVPDTAHLKAESTRQAKNLLPKRLRAAFAELRKSAAQLR